MRFLRHSESSPINVTHGDGVVSIHLEGGDLEEEVRSGRLGHVLRSEIQPGVERVWLDLGGSELESTRIVAVLVAAERQARTCGTRLFVVPSEQLLVAIAICRLERVLPSVGAVG